MKQGSKKPRAGSGVRKKRRKKPGVRTHAGGALRAVLVAAVLIAAAGLVSLSLKYFRGDTAPLTENGGTAAPVLPEIPETIPDPVTQIPVRAAEPLVEKEAGKKPPPQEAPAPVAKPAVSLPPSGITERPSLQSSGSLAFVIDDAGYNLRDLDPFLKLDGPLTIAVLPALPYSAEAARRIRAAGKEVFLHQPMEALGGQNPGPGAIRSGMDREEIRAVIIRNLEEIGPVAGINNHEGSRITMDEDAMETILGLCRERGILFLDSRTTAETAAPMAAQRLGMTIGERDIFIDNVKETDSMLTYINSGLAKAEQKGTAIMIGHVTTAELAPLLEKLLPDFKARGYSLLPASKLIDSLSPIPGQRGGGL